MDTFPNWLALMELWLQTHHNGQPAVIFTSALNADIGLDIRVEEMRKRFGEDLSKVVNAEFAVLVCKTHEEANRILRETPENNPYTLVWDGTRLTSHH